MTDSIPEKFCPVQMHDGKPCGRTVSKEDGKTCFFHLSGFLKDENEFNQLLNEYIKEVESSPSIEEYDFSGFVFPSVTFERKTFSKPVYVFEAKFEREANFFGAVFLEYVDFHGSEFDKKAKFAYTEFKKSATFSETYFKKTCDFAFADFKSIATFSSASFEDEKSTFYRANFYDQAVFTQASFRGNGNFIEAKFRGAALFVDCRFDKTTYFAGTLFKDIATFVRTLFQGEVFFNGAEFATRVDFSSVLFLKQVKFLQVKFNEGPTVFYNCLIRGEMDLTGTNFGGPIAFGGLSFGDNLYLDKCVFKDYVDFSRVTLEKTLRLRDISLENWLLAGTDISKMEFWNVSWRKVKYLFGERLACLDEMLISNKEMLKACRQIFPEYQGGEPEVVAETCRFLKKNFENKGNFPEAGDFHIGEMELRRLKHRSRAFSLWGKVDYTLTTLYKWVSHYGENYVLPLLWICALLPFFTWLFMIVGLNPTYLSVNSVIDYDFAIHLPILEGQFWCDTFSALKHTLSIFYFSRFQYYYTANFWGPYLNIAGYLLSVAVHAFFLLALRRRFKR